MTLDECLQTVPQDVRECIEAVCERAGTYDADWQVLKAAGEMLAEWKRSFEARVKRALHDVHASSD